MLLSFNAAWICLTDVVWKMQYGEEKKKVPRNRIAKTRPVGNDGIYLCRLSVELKTPSSLKQHVWGQR